MMLLKLRFCCACLFLSSVIFRAFSHRSEARKYSGVFMRYFEMRIVRARTDEEGHFAIMTARNVDETAREELRVQREIEKANKELARALETAENANRSKTDFLSRMRGWNGFSGKERGTLHLSIAERWTADLCGYPPELF